MGLGAPIFRFGLIGALVLANGCGRTEPRGSVDVQITGVRFDQNSYEIGQRGVEVWVSLHNQHPDDVAVALSAEVTTSPEGSLRLWSVTQELPTIAPGQIGELRLVGFVDVLATQGSVVVLPRVNVVHPAANRSGFASVRGGPWSVELVSSGPSLVVDTVVDEMDGPVGMADPSEAAPNLSLREALTLVNNGGEFSRITFDPVVFSPGAGATIRVADGPAGAIPLPELTRDRTTVDGAGHAVVIESLVPDPVFSITASAVSLKALELRGGGSAVRAVGAPDLTVDDVDLLGVYVSPEALTLASFQDCDRLRFTGSNLQFTGQTATGNFFRVEASEDVVVSDFSANLVNFYFANSPGALITDGIILGTSATRNLLTLLGSPNSVIDGVSFQSSWGDAMIMDASDGSIVTNVTASDCLANCTTVGMISVDNSQGVTVRGLEGSDWTAHGLFLKGGSNAGVPAPVVDHFDDGAIGGAVAAAGGWVDVAVRDSRTRYRLGEAAVSEGRWELAESVDAGVFVVASFTGDSGTSAEILTRRPRPSLCGAGRSVYRNSFEADEDGWALGGGGQIGIAFADASPMQPHDGTRVLRNTDPGTEGWAELSTPVDLSTTSQPALYLRIRTTSDHNGEFKIAVDPGTGWVETVADVAASTTWTVRSVDLSAAMDPEVRIRVDFTPNGEFYMGIDQVEICDG